VNETMRTASILPAICCVLIANPALCVGPQPGTTEGSQPTTKSDDDEQATDSTTPSRSTSNNAAAVPVTTRPSAPATEAPITGSSVAASPYGPAKSPGAAAQSAKSRRDSKKAYDGPPTLLDMTGDYAIGGFGGVGVMYTRFAGIGAPQVCGDGGVLIDHVLELGGGGCMVTTTVNAQKFAPSLYNPDDRMQFGYGGAIIRYHLFSRRVVNLGIGALIGAGGLTIGTWDSSSNDFASNYKHMRSEAVFVFEPQLGAYSNFTRWLRIGATVGYRIVSSVNTQGVSARDLSAPTLGGVLQGGWF
jgi:hypothetical protein